MNIVKTCYVATTGCYDITPSFTRFGFEIHTDIDTDIVVFKPASKFPSNQFNEIQISGDPDLRRSFLPEGDEGTSILFLDDPDYDTKFFRRQNMASKNLPLSVSDDFIRRWVALSSGNQQLIELGALHGAKFCDGGVWGGIEDINVKKGMLPYIENMDLSVKDSLSSISSNSQWAAEFIVWRNELSGRIKFTEV